MLDDFMKPQPARAKPSMLDSFTDPQPAKASPKAPPSMLDSFMDPQPTRPTKPQPQPQQAQAKAPEPLNYPSLLDAFNYPSPPFTRTGTPSITRAGTPAPMLAKIGKSSLASETTNDDGGEEGAGQKDESGDEVKATNGSGGSAEIAHDEVDDVKHAGEDGEKNDVRVQQRDEERIAGFGGGGGNGGKKMERKKVVEEPSAASILDNFDS